MLFYDRTLSSLFVVVVSSLSSSLSSSSSSPIEDLASIFLRISFIMLVAGGGGGAGDGLGVGVSVGGVSWVGAAATAANYSDSDSQSSKLPRLRRSNPGRPWSMNVPNARQLNRDMLRSRLGSDFNPDWMSIDAPPAHSRQGHETAIDQEMMNNLKELNFSYEDEHGGRRTIPAAVRSIFERWLLQRASCSVQYTWEEKSPVFWPRWIKQGRCDTDAACSWPPGMTCMPGESDTLRLLHWQCRRSTETNRRRMVRNAPDETADSESDVGRHRRSQKLHCRWKKVPYPVTSQCFCSC